jgi:hypothetical protein
LEVIGIVARRGHGVPWKVGDTVISMPEKYPKKFGRHANRRVEVTPEGHFSSAPEAVLDRTWVYL